ncbi:hypothetical protein BC628DRAFT_1332449 [Trametes gibbosa]|nr:hypothetical protein BC628DRAFT_1332449 [Trametes gibbosa]
MIFNKSILATTVLCLGLSLQVSAHAAIAPALGIQGNPVRDDAQRPQKGKECGNVDIAKNFDSSKAITAATNGTFAATITNFNAGIDGSRQVTALIDPTGTGKSFVSANVLQNGDKNPGATGSQQLVVQMPSGAACTGGASKNKCLVSFTTAGGFGNCVVVTQAAGAPQGSGDDQNKGQGQGKGKGANQSTGATSSSVNASASSSPASSSTPAASSSAPVSASTSASSASVPASASSAASTAASTDAAASNSVAASVTSSASNPSQTDGLTASQIDAQLQAEFEKLKQEIEKKLKVCA